MNNPSTLTEKDKCIKIAEACGWDAYKNLDTAGGWIAKMPSGESCYDNLGATPLQAIANNCPNYFHDLNAMHDAEKCPRIHRNAMTYLNCLEEETDTCCATTQQWSFATATAAQRAEAFGKALELWK